MDPHIADVLARMEHDFAWFMTIIIGMLCMTLSALAFLWWRLRLTLARYHGETAKMLADGHAIAQAIAAQTRELLRRTEP